MQFNKILAIMISIVITNNNTIQASENLQVKNNSSISKIKDKTIPIRYCNPSNPDDKKYGYVV